jgi:hypothetical protein
MFTRTKIHHALPVSLALLLILAVAAPTLAGDKGFTNLITGDNLDNWHNPYDWGQAKLVDGEVHLTANRKFFLVTNDTYGDFVFKCEVKMPKGKSNSGIMFRCHKKHNRVWGYQAEVDPSSRKWAGGLYDEGRRGWLSPLKNQPKKQNAFKRHGWNEYKIKCVGDRLQIWVNGVKTTDYRDPVDIAGHIALQHHGEDGQLYRFRNVKVKSLGRHAWKPIFNGKNLDGWQGKGAGQWQVKDGVLQGTMDGESSHGILLSEKPAGDFTARVKFKAVKGNSGFYFRTEPVDSGVIVHGLQAEIARNFNVGGLYETGGRGWAAKPDSGKVKKVYKPGQWTTMTVSAHGQQVVTHVNGKRIVVLDKAGRSEGYFGLQLHGGQKMDVRFKAVEVLQPVSQ